MRNKIKRSFKRKGIEMIEKQDLHKQASVLVLVAPLTISISISMANFYGHKYSIFCCFLERMYFHVLQVSSALSYGTILKNDLFRRTVRYDPNKHQINVVSMSWRHHF